MTIPPYPELTEDDYDAVMKLFQNLQKKAASKTLVNRVLQWDGEMFEIAPGCAYQVKTLCSCVQFAWNKYLQKEFAKNILVWRDVIAPWFASTSLHAELPKDNMDIQLGIITSLAALAQEEGLYKMP